MRKKVFLILIFSRAFKATSIKQSNIQKYQHALTAHLCQETVPQGQYGECK